MVRGGKTGRRIDVGALGDERFLVSGFCRHEGPNRASKIPLATSETFRRARHEFALRLPVRRGSIFMVGSSRSRGFPVTAGALQKAFGGGKIDGVLAVVSADGSKLLYATYLGGAGNELIRGLALGPAGEAYLVGRTDSPGFPVTAGAAQAKAEREADAFLVKLSPPALP